MSTRPIKAQQTAHKHKILWAVDALEETQSPESKGALPLGRKTSHFLHALERGLHADIHPVFILSPVQIGFGDYELQDMRTHIPAAQRALDKNLSHYRFEQMQRPMVLVNRQSSVRSAVETLVRYSRQGGFDWILTGSHGRRGVNRFFLGSFAEELILASKIPVIVVGQGADHIPTRIKRILFPTHFEKGAQDAFKRLLEFARLLDAEVHILHFNPRPMEAALQSGVFLLSGGWMSGSDGTAGRREAAELESARWLSISKKAGVHATYEFDAKPDSVTDALLKRSGERRDQMIAMTTHSGRWAATWIGSVAREVIRRSHCPVWVARTS